MAKLDASLTLEQFIKQRLVDVLGIPEVKAQGFCDQVRKEMSLVGMNFSLDIPLQRVKQMTRFMVWSWALEKCAIAYGLAVRDFVECFGDEL